LKNCFAKSKVKIMKLRPQIILLTSLCLAALCLSGCANCRYSIFGCVSARASLLEKGPVLYTAITIEPPTNKPAPPFCLRFPSGQVVQLSALTWDVVKGLGYTNVYVDYRSKDYHDLSVTGRGAMFRFENDKPVWIYVTPGEVGISREDSKRFYTLPLTQDKLEELFGHPDKINSGIEW
jgi:hypothetical protein